jgi:DNA polymerase-4
VAAELQPLIDKVWWHCESTGNRGRTVTLKIKFADFEIISRSRSVPDPVGSRIELERIAIGLLEKLIPMPKAVRLLGMSISALQNDVGSDAIQMMLAI